MQFTGQDGEVKLMVINPGHFHASLLQKNANNRVYDTIYVYAPEGEELNQYINAIEGFNTREDSPTAWQLNVYAGDDFLEKAMADKLGNVVILAGNNQYKTQYIADAIAAGLHVLSDKPMAINEQDFISLRDVYHTANLHGVYLYDLMTERYDILNIIEKNLLVNKDVFGELQKGTVDNPAIFMESVHHFYKEVEGKPLIRPAWYYDVAQQGEGIADVTTHLIDLVFWQCFPEEAINFKQDVEVLHAAHWPTILNETDFFRSTQVQKFPAYLDKYIQNSELSVNANGVIDYMMKGVHVGLKVMWNYQAPEGGGDTFSSVKKGSKAHLITIQNASVDFKKQLLLEKTDLLTQEEFISNVQDAISVLQQTFPFVDYVEQIDGKVLIVIPFENRLAHEVHFGYVAQQFFDYLVAQNMPEWEDSNTIAKYYITTTATTMANQKDD